MDCLDSDRELPARHLLEGMLQRVEGEHGPLYQEKVQQ